MCEERITNNNYKSYTYIPCPCCGYLTIADHPDAVGFICPICYWEIDPFIRTVNEPSDQNSGLMLIEARQNYNRYGAVLPRLRQYVRSPKDNEIPKK